MYSSVPFAAVLEQHGSRSPILLFFVRRPRGAWLCYYGRASASTSWMVARVLLVCISLYANVRLGNDLHLADKLRTGSSEWQKSHPPRAALSESPPPYLFLECAPLTSLNYISWKHFPSRLPELQVFQIIWSWSLQIRRTDETINQIKNQFE